MRRARANTPAQQQATVPSPKLPVPLDDGTVALEMIQALIPLGLRAVEEEVRTLAGARSAHHDGHPDVVRWRRQRGSMADQ